MEVVKRNGNREEFNSTKIEKAIKRALDETQTDYGEDFLEEVAEWVEVTLLKEGKEEVSIEDIQDQVEVALMMNYPLAAKAYILYRREREDLWNKGWDMTDLQMDIYESKYRLDNESFREFVERVAKNNRPVQKAILEKKFLPAGRILAGRGLWEKGRKITLNNCYVAPLVEDNVESIWNTARDMARTYSYGGGIGICIDKLRPKGFAVSNAALTTSGAVSFMDLFSLTTELIGAKGRRGALMVLMDITHPDIEEFIDVKKDLNKVKYANISVKLNQEFLNAARDNQLYTLRFTTDTGVYFEKEVKARNLLWKIAKNIHDNAEPGIAMWDRIGDWHFKSQDPEFSYAGTNPCFTSDMKLLTVDGYKTFGELEGTEPYIINKDGEVVQSKVWVSGHKNIVKMRLSNKDIIECTPDHVFLTTEGDEVMAENARGERLASYSMENGNKEEPLTVVEVVHLEDKVKVFDFTEPKTHWGVVNGVIAHNCGEAPLSAGGACCLGSINLGELVLHPFTKHAEFDYPSFINLVHEGITFLDQIVEENLDHHPLEIQKEIARKYREVGLGVMGVADTFIKMGLKYDSEEAARLIEEIMSVMINEAARQTALLAKEYGPAPGYTSYIPSSSFFKENLDSDVKDLIKQYGMRNTQLVAIAPTGSIGTMLGCSTGLEPLFQVSYQRRTISINDREETKYKVYAPVVKELKEALNINNDDDLPSCVVTAMTIDPKERIKLQGRIQKKVDAAISSTVNLPEETSVSEVFELLILAAENGLKGVTMYRDNCAREGILTNDVEEEVEEAKNLCPDCGGEIIYTNGCSECLDCGFSACSI